MSKIRSFNERVRAGNAPVAALVIAILVVFSGFNFSRLVEVGQETQKGTLYFILWPIAQAQYHTLRLADRLAPAPDNDPSESALVRKQLDVTIGSLSQLIEGQYRSVLIEYGDFRWIKEHHDELSAFKLSDDGASAAFLRNRARAIAADLRDLSNKLVLKNHAHAEELRSQYLQILLETAAAFVCVLLASVFFTVNFLRSVNENKRTKQRLVEQERLADLVINNVTSQGIVIFDEHLTCLLWNPGMETLLGVNASDVTGSDIRQSVPFFNKSSVGITLAAAINGTHSVIEDEGTSPTGRDRLLEIHSYPLKTGGRRMGIAFILDMSEHWQARRQAERQNVDLEMQVRQHTMALQQAERRLIAAIETAPEGFAAFDSSGRLLFANERIREAAAPIGDIPPQEMMLPDFLDRLTRFEMPETPIWGRDDPFEKIAIDLPVAADTWAHLSVTKADGGTIFMRLTDITQHKRASNALVSALDRERETTKAYRDFVSMVSHQFRTPLAILDSSAQRLLRQKESVTQEDLSVRIQRMRGAISRLTHLVESVLNAAKLDAGQIEFRPGICNLLELVDEHCERQRELTPYASIALHAVTPEVRAFCDSLLVEQVIVNLLSNAVKYSGEHPRIDVRVWTDGVRAYCSVLDKGVGIPADEMPRIFDRFYRARTAMGIAGTGIGLNFAQNIMHLHGGNIRVRSDVALGSEFTFDLPVEQADLQTRAA